jgi:hypothetical protein
MRRDENFRVRMPDSGTATVQMPVVRRDLQIVPGSWNEKARTVDIIWSTGARIQRYDWFREEWWYEELSLDPKHVRMGRMQAGASVLANHDSWGGMDRLVGRVVSASLENGEGRATVKLSGRADLEGFRQDVAEGIATWISVGYRVYELEDAATPEERERRERVLRAIDWEPMEVSFVLIPADAGAQVRSDSPSETNPCLVRCAATAAAPAGDPTMTRTTTTPGNPAPDPTRTAPPAPPAEPTRAAEPAPAAPAPATNDAVRAERERCALVDDLCTRHGLPNDFRLQLRDGASGAAPPDAARVRELVLNRLADESDRTFTGGPVNVTRDERDKVRSAASIALLHRAYPSHPDHKLTAEARDFRGMTLREMARECLERQGERTRGMSPNELAQRALQSTSDFPIVLGDVANKSMLMGFNAAPQTFWPFVRRTTASDFKDVHRVRIGEFPKLEKVNESGEVKRGSMGETEEKYRLATYAKAVGITRQVIINDDLGAFTRIPQGYGWAAADLMADTVYAILTVNGNMADGIALFHATHNNLITGAGSALGLTGLTNARVAMMKQKALDGKKHIMVVPKFLIVPVALLTTAEQLTAAISASTVSEVNPFNDRLQPIADPRLDVDSAAKWYLAGEPGQVDTIEACFLDGEEGPRVEQRIGFDVDGLEIKVAMDFAAAPVEHRGMLRANGS